MLVNLDRSSLMDNKVDAYKIGIGQMSGRLGGVTQAYHDFTGACFEEGALSTKEKQLIALGISLFANNEVCTYYHVGEALASGASEQEILEATAVASAVGAGYVMSQGVTRVEGALTSQSPSF